VIAAAKRKWMEQQGPERMRERRQAWRNSQPDALRKQRSRDDNAARKTFPVPNRKQHVYPLDPLPILGAAKLAAITGLSYADAARYIRDDLKLTLNQADRAAVALGQSLETLWPDLTIRAA
jgi:hypothetical protein